MKKELLILTGMKHCGKSTTGKSLAADLKIPFFDIDDEITETAGKTPRQLYDEGGQPLFQQYETQVCRILIEELETEKKRHGTAIYKETFPQAVIATGGGICDNEQAIEALREYGSLFYLKAPETVLMDRIMNSAKRDGRLPAYISAENPKNDGEIYAIFHRFYTLRSDKYVILADKVIDTEGGTWLQVIRLIKQEINDYQYAQRNSNNR